MKKILVFILVIVFLISGCSFDVQMVTPAPVTSDNLSITQEVVLPISTAPAATESASATPQPISSDVFFHDAFFTVDAVNGPGQPTFPAGTKQVFGIWEYQNMQAGMLVKREWLLNGQPWLTREEPWDFAKYGSSGTLRDISIYDNDIGLPSGAYQLKLSVNNVLQPIGNSLDGSLRDWTSFEILPATSIPQVYSPDTQSVAAVLDGKTLIVRDAGRRPNVLHNGHEILHVSWLSDNQHVVFVDRDRSNQQGTTGIGIRDDLWIVDVQTSNAHLLYKSQTALGENSGFVASPDSRYVAGTEGSAYGDACVVDAHLIFFALASDFQSANVIKQQQFADIPVVGNGAVYPAETGSWKNNTQYFTKLNAACTEQSMLGMYSFDVLSLKVKNVSAGTSTPIPGDLGWGTIHGKVVDANSGAPIVGAIVTCQHSSYTSPYPCQGTAITGADGTYAFNEVFFHDTDTIKLTIQAPGYQTEEITRASFTLPNLQADILLKHIP